MFIRFTCASVLALTSATGVFAATTQFTGEAAFLTALGETPDVTIDFEAGFTDNQDVDGTTISGMTITAAAGEFARIEQGNGSIGGSNPIGSFALELGDNPGTSVTFSFANAISYFGFYYIDAASPTVNGFDFSGTGSSGSTETFGGLTFDLSDNVTQVVFSSIGGDGTWGLDDIVFGATTPAPVPLPAGLPLLLSGALAFGVMRRRQRS